MSTQPGSKPSKGPLILLGVAIGAVGMLMVVLVFLGVVWVGFTAYRSRSAPSQPVPMQPQFDPPAPEPPLNPPPMRRPTPERLNRLERTELPPRMVPVEPTEPPAPTSPGSVAPVLHVRSRSGNLLDGKALVLETAGEVRNTGGGYLIVSDSAPLRIRGPMTVSIWFNARSIDRSMTLGSRALNGPPWQFPYSSWIMRVNSSTLLEASLAGGGYSPSTWSVRLNPGQWYHAVMTYDGLTKKLFLNGVRQNQLASGTLTQNVPIAITPGRSILIGADESEPPVGDLFDGAIDDVRIFNRALPEEEIIELYAKPPPGAAGGNRLRE